MGATIAIPQGASKAYVMLVNKGDKDGYFTALSFTFLGETESDAGVDAQQDVQEPTEAGNTDAQESEDAKPPTPSSGGLSDDDDGCGCRTVTGHSQSSWLVGLLALAGMSLMRRSNRKSHCR